MADIRSMECENGRHFLELSAGTGKCACGTMLMKIGSSIRSIERSDEMAEDTRLVTTWSSLICDETEKCNDDGYLETILDALKKYNNRNNVARYGKSWREARTGTKGAYNWLYSKVERLYSQLWLAQSWDGVPLEEATDSALDAVNYSAFLATLLREQQDGKEVRFQ